MHITLHSKPSQSIEIPLHYNHILQGVIYNSIDLELVLFLHDKGYVSNGHSFKMFAFSQLKGKYEINHVFSYKNTIVKGYSGKLLISGPRGLLQMAVDSGLGSKGSQGFGCIELK